MRGEDDKAPTYGMKILKERTTTRVKLILGP